MEGGLKHLPADWQTRELHFYEHFQLILYNMSHLHIFFVDSTVFHYGSGGNRTRGSKFQIIILVFFLFFDFMVGCNHDVTIIMTE